MNRLETQRIVSEITKDLREGDILFARIPRYLFKKVAQATASWTNHVGIVLKCDGKWVVAESVIPFVQLTPLEKFLRRCDSGYLCLKRLNFELTATQIQAIYSEVHKQIGTLYHLGFNFDTRRTFCSKLVYEVFQRALGVEVGQIQRFRDLLETHPNPKQAKRFWWWYFWGFIPWERRFVSPANQLNAGILNTVYLGSRVRSQKREISSF